MRKVFILGNGFDLNLGLETSYSHFLKSDIFKEYLKNIAEPDRHSLGKHLVQQNNVSNWVDIEVELANYSMNHADSHFLSDYRNLCLALREYLLIQQSAKIQKQSEAYRLLSENYKDGDELKIITFNYTDTAEKILKEIFNFIEDEDGITFDIQYVHGSINQKNIIFGVDDSHEIAAGHTAIRKTTHQNFSGHIIRKALFEHSDEIHFFGISLGETDHMYFKEYFTSRLCATLINKKHKFYVYQQKGWDSLHHQFYELTEKSTNKLKTNNPPEIFRLE